MINRRLLLALAAMGCAQSACASKAGSQVPPYRDPGLSIEARIEDLLERMTLEEKIAQMQGVWLKKNRLHDSKGEFSAAAASENFPDGLGQISRPGDRMGVESAEDVPAVAGAIAGSKNRDGRAAAAYANAAQKWAREQTRLGIPLLMHEEALHGFVANGATSFPQAIALASSWDPDLVSRVMAVAAREMRLRGAHLALAPVLDVARDPRWGRSEETFGEDPYLVAQIGIGALRGLQGPTLPLAGDKVFATLKHLTGHGQPENGINVGPAQISERFLRENFLAPFEQAIRAIPVRSVMASYNEIDGVPSHVNRWLLDQVLRQEWGFEGVVVSDYFALRELQTVHAMVADDDEAALRSLQAGVDIELPDIDVYTRLPDLVRAGSIEESSIDRSVRRLLRLKFEAGLFENPYVDEALAEPGTAASDAIALAREAAARSIILLKNEGQLLPLDPQQPGRLLVIGPHAQDTPLGGYSDQPRHVTSVLEGLRQGAGEALQIDYAQGFQLTRSRVWEADPVDLVPAEENQVLVAQALVQAEQADVILLVLGENEQLSREAWSPKHLGDRASLDLVGPQNALAEAVFALGKPTIVLMLNGRPLTINTIAEGADALLQGWYLGQETGSGVADVVFGRVSPAGKLPVSIPRSVGQLPIYYSRKPSARRGYLFDEATPLFAFGFGLTYSSFALAPPKLSKPSLSADGTISLLLNVTNTGTREAEEVVQVYARDVSASVTRPIRELKRFQRLRLKPGQSRSLQFELSASDFAFWNSAMKRVAEPGEVQLQVGFNSEQLQSVSLQIE